MTKTINFILDSPLLPAIGVIASIFGIIAFFLPWSSVGNYTGLEFLLGDTPFSGLQSYMPTATLILMFVILGISIVSIIDKQKRMTFYGMIIFGFITLVVIMLFGNWTPMDGYKLLTNGGSGFYLELAAGIIYFLAGVVGYSVRPLPPPPEKPLQNRPRR